MINKEPTNLGINTSFDLLSAVYQQSRNEGIKIVHSMFRDYIVIITVTVAIFGGQIYTHYNQFLIIIPIFLGIYLNIMLGKLRTNNLITCYMIYLEQLINKKLGEPIVIWNSLIASKNLKDAIK